MPHANRRKPDELEADTAISTSAPTDIALDQLGPALAKVQNALQQEVEGKKLWVEGTLEIAKILDDLRKRYSSDQAFGKALSANGYGENRITRQDRAALLNMAKDLDLTRKVLEQTHSRSWRVIWEQEIQPHRLPSVGQPAEGEQPEASTRRPKKNSAKKSPKPAPDNDKQDAQLQRLLKSLPRRRVTRLMLDNWDANDLRSHVTEVNRYLAEASKYNSGEADIKH